MLARLARNAAGLRNALLDLLFPPRCVVCRREGSYFCAACSAQIEKINPPICQRCGRPSPDAECPSCKKSPMQIDGTRAVAFFEGNLRVGIH
ncbi:MAG: double zinc ribbon domain-containing protein, partial [Chloroflexota bacterium]